MLVAEIRWRKKNDSFRFNNLTYLGIKQMPIDVGMFRHPPTEYRHPAEVFLALAII